MAERIKHQVECSSANLIKSGSDKDMVAICLGHFNDLANEVAALSTTPARAEAQDEGAAGEIVAFDWRYLEFDGKKTEHLTRYDPRDSTRHDKSWVKDVRALYAHPSPTPAAIKVLIAELREARGLLQGFIDDEADAVTNPLGGLSLGGLMDARDNSGCVYQSAALADRIVQTRAFLARNEKGEG